MLANAFTSLPAEWQSWIKDGLSRGCVPSGMAQVMIRDGRFDERVTHAALKEACAAAGTIFDVADLPNVDTSFNTVQTPDRVVNILMAMKLPRIVLLGNVLSDEECEALIDQSETRLERSAVVGDADGVDQLDERRTSRGKGFQRGETDLLARIEARLAALVNWPLERGEGLTVLRYEHGNEYRAHYDWFDPQVPGGRRQLERGGQRVGTIVMYLSDVEAGGATSFPKVGLEVQPRKGCAVFFHNLDMYGAPEQMSFHAGEPVIQGVKYVATKWLRERRFV